MIYIQFSCITTTEKHRQRNRSLLDSTFDYMEFAFDGAAAEALGKFFPAEAYSDA